MRIIGKVIKGAGLGYKTANLKIDLPLKLANGVYLAQVSYQHQVYPAIAIRGVRPDLEVYLLDFDGDLYNQILEVEIFDKMREIIKFKEKEELLKQIQEDIERAREYFNNAD